MHKDNRTHSTKDCFELNQRAKRTKSNPSSEKGHVTYKDLNAFVNAKVTEALKKAKKEQKKAKRVTINAFDKFCSLNINSSSKESDHEVNTLATASDDDSDSDDSRAPSEDSKSDDE
eukprot:4192355-Ditylum_brightwellii.AAC.1